MWIALVAATVLAAAPPEETPVSKEQLAEQIQTLVKDSKPQASKALKQLKQLVTKENFKSLGFDSLEEVASAELGPALPVLIVRLDELREYKEKGEPYKLLHLLPKVMYMVFVNNETRCGVEVEKRDEKWITSALGVAGPTRQYASAILKQTEKDKAIWFFLVKVQALNLTYLAYKTEEGVRLIHVRQQAEAKEKVESKTAAEVLVDLVKQAKEHDGTLR